MQNPPVILTIFSIACKKPYSHMYSITYHFIYHSFFHKTFERKVIFLPNKIELLYPARSKPDTAALLFFTI